MFISWRKTSQRHGDDMIKLNSVRLKLRNGYSRLEPALSQMEKT
jgi:hypothetical protein